MSDFEIYQRSTGSVIKEQVFGAKALSFACNNIFGKMLTGLLLKRKFVSKIVSLRYKSKASRKMIPSFMEQYGISSEDLDKPVSEYESFNDFFTRTRADALKVPESDISPKALISPADSRLMVHKIKEGSVFSVKGQLYTVADFLQSEEDSKLYENGLCLVFRLCPTDYHRYCFPDSGKICGCRKIKGFYRSVNTFFVSPKVHVSNYREVSTLDTEDFGKMAFAEVGAMLIGKVVNTFEGQEFAKGQEKGYFEYGASTVVLLLREDAAEIDADILEQSAAGRECLVKYGEKIGVSCK